MNPIHKDIDKVVIKLLKKWLVHLHMLHADNH
jgi:hypothetical protein